MIGKFTFNSVQISGISLRLLLILEFLSVQSPHIPLNSNRLLVRLDDLVLRNAEALHIEHAIRRFRRPLEDPGRSFANSGEGAERAFLVTVVQNICLAFGEEDVDELQTPVEEVTAD
jgi:hypothetical protein